MFKFFASGLILVVFLGGCSFFEDKKAELGKNVNEKIEKTTEEVKDQVNKEIEETTQEIKDKAIEEIKGELHETIEENL